LSVDEATEDAARIRAQAEREAAAYVDAAKRRADAFAEARIARLRELSDRLIATAETVERRFEDATTIKRQLDDLVSALGAAAERAASERERQGFESTAAGAADPAPAAPAARPGARPRAGTAFVEVLEPARTPSRPTVP
jgi:hypothetical protein